MCGIGDIVVVLIASLTLYTSDTCVAEPIVSSRRIGRSRSPIVVVDNVLAWEQFEKVERRLRSSDGDVGWNDGEGVNFPGRVSSVDKETLEALVSVLAREKDVIGAFPSINFGGTEDVSGFVSVLCECGGVHTDHMEFLVGHVNPPPVAVLYFDSKNPNSILESGTAFYRERNSGMERLSEAITSNIQMHCENFPESLACWNNFNDSHKNKSLAFDQIDLTVSKPNRLVMYPQDILHSPWMKGKTASCPTPSMLGDPHIARQEIVNNIPLDCSAEKGRLTITLFFSSKINALEVPADDRSLTSEDGVHLSVLLGEKAYWKTKLMRHMTEPIVSSGRDLSELNSCPELQKSTSSTSPNIVNIIESPCILESTIRLEENEVLVIQGATSENPVLLHRGGKAQGSQEVFDRHFDISGNATLVLSNVELDGAYVGIGKSAPHSSGNVCDACGYCLSVTSCGNICGYGETPNQCCWSCYGCNSYGTTCNHYCDNACSEKHKGGAIRLHGSSSAFLFNVSFGSSNIAFGKAEGRTIKATSGDVYIASATSRLYLSSKADMTNKMILADGLDSNQIDEACLLNTPKVLHNTLFLSSNLYVLVGRCTEHTHNNARFCLEGMELQHDGFGLSCRACASGEYLDASVCKNCPLGYFSDQPMNSACKNCPPGRYMMPSCDLSRRGSLNDCTQCVVGAYQDVPSMLSCKTCEDGRTTRFQGSTNVKDCYDPVSITRVPLPTPIEVDLRFTVANSDETFWTAIKLIWQIRISELQSSDFAEIGSFNIQFSTAKDFAPRSLVGEFVNISAAEQLVSFSLEKLRQPIWKSVIFSRVRAHGKVDERAFSQFGPWSAITDPWVTSDTCVSTWLNTSSSRPVNWHCADCPKGAFCNGGPWSQVSAMFGYYRIQGGEVPNRFVACHNPPACLGAPNYILREKHVIDNIDLALLNLEEHCNHKLGYKNGSRLCAACIQGYGRSRRFECSKCEDTGAQRIAIAMACFTLLLCVFVFFIYSSIAGAGSFKNSESVQKIAINYLQVIGVFSSFSLRWPKTLVAMFDVQGFVSSAGLQLINADCLNPNMSSLEVYYTAQIVYATLPSLFVCVIFGTWYAIAACKNIHFSQRVDPLTPTPKDKCITTSCAALYLMYPTLCKNAFSLFICTEVEKGHFYLVHELEEECFVNRHLTMSLIIGIFQLVAYVLSLPALTFYMIWRNRRGFWKIAVKMRYGLFLGGYSEKRYYWEFVVTIRKVSVILVSSFSVNLSVWLQVHIMSLLLAILILVQIFGQPFIFDDNATVDPTNTLQRLEVTSLCVLWFTFWCGMTIHEADSSLEGTRIFLIICIAFVNMTFMLYAARVYVIEFIREQLNARKQFTSESFLLKCCKRCCCTRETIVIQRLLSLKSFKLFGSNGCSVKSKMEVQGQNEERKWETSSEQYGQFGITNPMVSGAGEVAAKEIWRTMIDEVTGKPYMYSEKTGETKWVHNVETEDKKGDENDEWQYMIDKNSGRPYWLHKKTQTTQWVHAE